MGWASQDVFLSFLSLFIYGGVHLPCCLGWFQTPGLKRSVSDCGCDFSHSL